MDCFRDAAPIVDTLRACWCIKIQNMHSNMHKQYLMSADTNQMNYFLNSKPAFVE